MKKITIGDQEYEINYGQNAICALEDELNLSVLELMGRIRDGKQRLSDLRAIIWAGMLARRRNLTPELVGTIIDSNDARIRDIASECIEDLSASFSKYIVAGDEKEEEPEKNA